MGMEISRNYQSFSAYGKNAEKATEAAEKAQTEKNAEYLEELNKKFPELKIKAGNFIPTQNDRRISFAIDPALLEKMQNDPEQEKETMELLKGAVQARILIASLHKATGWEYEYSHDYIDANGKFWHTAKSVKKDTANGEMRKKAREDSEKRIEEAIKNAKIKRKELIEMIKSDTADTGKLPPKKADTLELSPEALNAMEKRAAGVNEPEAAVEEEAEETGKADDTESSESRCAVSVNVGKRVRMIAAAETPDQVRVVLELLRGDLEDCKEGLEKGWCDEEEVKKAEALIEMANKRMSEVAGNEEEDTGGVGAFELSMLF